VIAIGVELLAGTYRATSGDDFAATAHDQPGEWPPSPARLVSALVAADGTGDRTHVTSGDELRILERAGDPLILADPVEMVVTSRQNERYVVVDQLAAAGRHVHEYPGRVSALVRPGARLSPKTPRIWYLWPHLQTGDEVFNSLVARAARVGYLGCADSPVRLRVLSEAPDEQSLAQWKPGCTNGEGVTLPVAYEGFVNDLDNLFERFSRGEMVRRAWMRGVHQTYGTSESNIVHESPQVVWLAFERSVPGRWALDINIALRRATFELYDRHTNTESEGIPGVLSGHGFSGSGYEHVSWFTLPDAGYGYSTGRLHGAGVCFPMGTDPKVIVGVKRALGHLDTLVTSDHRSVSVHLNDGSQRPVAADPRRWCRSSARWASVTPVVHERWGKIDLDVINEWCRHAGLPEAISFRSAPAPLVRGGLLLEPHEVHRSSSDRHPYSHMIIEFGQRVAGPVLLGRSRHFGMGLFCPLDSIGSSEEGKGE
jgi:CRISPR-associated protein Csb2